MNTAQAWEIKTTNAGAPIRWPAGEIVVDLAMEAEVHDISRESADSQVIAAFGSWAVAMGENMEIRYASSEDELLGTEKDFLNVVRWGTDADHLFVSPEALGTTYLTYRTSTGEILDADIVVNAVHYKWGVIGMGGCGQRYDLHNILAHEAGHFLGMAHSPDHKEATMYPSAPKCETSKRELSADDQGAALYLYDNLSLETTDSEPIELVNCSSAGGSGLLVALLVFAMWFRLACKLGKLSRAVAALEVLVALFGTRLLGGVTQARAHRALNRYRQRGPVSSWMFWGALMVSSWPPSASASTMRYLEPAELVHRADLVVEGKVLRQDVRLVGGIPMTFSTLKVFRCGVEECPKEIVVSQLGGEVGEIGLHVFGVTHLEPGSEFVLFLQERQGRLQPVARSQGMFRVIRNTGQEELVRDLEGVVLAAPDEKIVGNTMAPIRSVSRAHFDALFGKALWRQPVRLAPQAPSTNDSD